MSRGGTTATAREAPRDWYHDLTAGGLGGAVAARAGLPRPTPLRRQGRSSSKRPA